VAALLVTTIPLLLLRHALLFDKHHAADLGSDIL
jgi:hypothetical protein